MVGETMEENEDTRIYEVYKVTSPSGKVYIGRTCLGLDLRKRDHLYYAKRANTSFAKAIQKYNDNLVWEIIETVEGCSLANERERYWISYYRSNEKDKGYNLTSGGDGNNLTPEVESRRINALRKSMKDPSLIARRKDIARRLWQDKGFRDKNTKQQQERCRTEEHRAKISAQMKGHRCNRNKISESILKHYSDPKNREKHSKRCLQNRIRCFNVFKDGVLIGTYGNPTQAAKELNLHQPNISKCLRGQRKTTGGYTFKYIEESIQQDT